MVCQSNTFTEHLNHSETIFKKLKDADMTINLEKSNPCRQEIPFLGFRLTKQGIHRYSEKVEVITKFPSPRNHKQVKGFLGLTNFNNKFINKYTQLTKPLLHLTSKKNKFLWTEVEETAFKQLKEAFLNENFLEYPDPTKEYILPTDASNTCRRSLVPDNR